MHRRKRISENTSTPKRRRLGTGRMLRSPLANVFQKQFSPVQRNLIATLQSSQRCDSPPIPCNQKEYLSDSATNSSSSFIQKAPQSPGFLDSSFELENINTTNENCDTKTDATSNATKKHMSPALIQNEIENISDDMFHSKLEIQDSFAHQHEKDTLLASRCEKYFRQEIEQSFQSVNKSICVLESNQNHDNGLFETKDSFLLDIKETSVGLEEHKKHQHYSKALPNYDNTNTFYGLPLITKSLFKSYRNIEKFYDWQEECLNLDAIRNRKNLIYALPTSGGKTLVAEVLMLNEVLNRKNNALFILPFVAIVQEKIWALSPFAVQLDFLVEEYAGGKGHIPPKKRRKKNSIYIATIEKGLALIRSLIELNRLNEIGLIVVDELHLIGEAGRGSTLETLLSTVIFANKGIQIVGMSATIGNLPELAKFLSATIYERDFRPVELVEYVKLGDVLHKLVWGKDGLEVIPDRVISFDYSLAATSLDPDWLGGLVSEVTPAESCLVFCPTKRNCENVASLLCKIQRREMTVHRTQERTDLSKFLQAEGACLELVRFVRQGVAYHHAGLGSDERSALENAFRSGVLSVLCCTSTLAAGVNLPARRVIVRAPFVGRAPLSLAAYRQMAGRAGRAGHADNGESIIICSEREWPSFLNTLRGGLAPAQSALPADNGAGVMSLVLSAVAIALATTREMLRRLLECTLCCVQSDRLNIDIKQLCDEAIRSLLQNGAIRVQENKTDKQTDRQSDSHVANGDCFVYNDSVLEVSKLGNASIKGCLDLGSTRQLLQDLATASRGLVLMGSVHLLYLCTPQDSAGIRPDYRHYYRLYCSLNEECLQTANVLGITEKSAIRMITGKPITNVPETVLSRFYLALILYDLWNQVEFTKVVEKYALSRGTIQQLMTSAASMAASVARVCEQLDERWAFLALFSELAPRLQHCAAPELRQLCELPNVKKARALQLSRAGYKRIEQVARADVTALVAAIDHLSRSAAEHLISAARMMLIEKVENLRAEAEDVMEELNM